MSGIQLFLVCLAVFNVAFAIGYFVGGYHAMDAAWQTVERHLNSGELVVGPAPHHNED